MGKPPPYKIFRRITKNFFRSILPYDLPDVQNAENELIECWEKNGNGSAVCAPLEREYNRALAAQIEYKNTVKEQNYFGMIMKHTPKPINKYLKKGRYNDRFSFEPRHEGLKLRKFVPGDRDFIDK